MQVLGSDEEEDLSSSSEEEDLGEEEEEEEAADLDDDAMDALDEKDDEPLRELRTAEAAALAAPRPAGAGADADPDAGAGAAPPGADGEALAQAVLGVGQAAQAAAPWTQPGTAWATASQAECCEAVACVCDAIATLEATIEKLEGVPALGEWGCCGKRCLAEMVALQPEVLAEIAANARLLRECVQTRPAEAVQRGDLFVKTFKAKRSGRRGDASKKGNATNRLPTSKRSREKVLAEDACGWFRETRRRERRAYVKVAARQLLIAGMCIEGICTLLSCSNAFLYKHADAEIDEAEATFPGYVRRRRHGSRVGLPALADLHKEDCCAQACLTRMSDAFLELQVKNWKHADSERERAVVLVDMLYDSSSGTVSERCAASARLHLGVSKYKWDKVKELLKREGVENARKHKHKLQGALPWNKMSPALVSAIMQEFDLATLPRPDDNTL